VSDRVMPCTDSISRVSRDRTSLGDCQHSHAGHDICCCLPPLRLKCRLRAALPQAEEAGNTQWGGGTAGGLRVLAAVGYADKLRHRSASIASARPRKSDRPTAPTRLLPAAAGVLAHPITTHQPPTGSDWSAWCGGRLTLHAAQVLR